MIYSKNPANAVNTARTAFVRLVFTLAAAIFLCAAANVTASAAAQKVYDYGDLLTDSEEKQLEQRLCEASERCGQEIIVYTTDSLDGYSVSRRAEMAADEIHAGDSGILYLVAMDDREYDIFTFGEMDRIMSSSSRDRMAETLRPYLSRGDYYEAFTEFGTLAESAAGSGFVGSLHIELPPSIPISAAVISIIIVLVMKSGMKTTRPEITAGNYVRRGSFHLDRSRDVFLYSSISRHKIESSSGSRSSGGHRSSGSHHSGGHSSGRF